MNYYKPLQRESDKRWDYTVSNKRTGTYGIGYCRSWKEFQPGSYMTKEMCEQENKKFELFVSKFHMNGHASYDEACACYKEYLLDHTMDARVLPSQQHKCLVCGEWTQQIVEVGGCHLFNLCEAHSSREEVSKLFNVSESFGSM